jgi:hypothetical protein
MSPAINSAGGGSGGTQGTELGYDQITAPVNVASTTEATGTTIITCAAHAFDGAAVLATLYAPFMNTGTTAGSSVVLCLFEGATQIARLVSVATPAAAQAFAPVCAQLRFTPTVGSHTYTVTAFTSNVTGTPAVGAGASGTGAYAPAFIRFTKV